MAKRPTRATKKPSKTEIVEKESAVIDTDVFVDNDDGSTKLLAPSNKRPSFIKAGRVATYGEVCKVDADGIAHVFTQPAINILLKRNWTRV